MHQTRRSIPRRSKELGIAQTTLWRIMRKIFGPHAFKIKLTQELKPLDHLKRRTIDLLKSKFGERVISRNGPVE